MGKKRNAKSKSCSGGEGITTSSRSHGGATSKDSKFSVFEFSVDDLRVETDSRKSLAKFGTKSPSKKHAHHRQSVDKYDFLACFTRGTMTQQNSGNDMSDVDVTDGVFEDRTFRTDVTTSTASLNCESHVFSSLKHQSFECSSCGAKSCEQGTRKPGGYTTGKKHNKVFYVDSDEDGRMELSSSTSCFDLAENEGSLEKQSSECGAKVDDCEAVVVVTPSYVKYGNRYYTRCFLTFSQRCIRLEGSPLCERQKHLCLEWSTLDILKIECQQCESVNADVVNLHLNTNVAETRNGNSDAGIAELEFVVLEDPQWSKKQEEIKTLDRKYEDVWETIISECSFNEPFEDIIYPEGDPDAVFISRRDIEQLQPRAFINDTIIDFYMKYLFNKTKPEEQHMFHFFNTFFFRKLVDMDQDLSRALEGRDAFQRVRKWTKNVDLFKKDYILIPVNFSLHWSLIVICHPGEVANIRDKGMDDSSKVPCILHMDSIRGSHRGFENLIRSYLWEEWKERQDKQEEDISTKFLNLDFVSLQLPQQENLFDCGLFLLHYAELFLEQASNFSATKYFDFLHKDWFLSAEVSLKKRDHIRKLIHRIVEDNTLKDPPAACIPSDINEGDSGAEPVTDFSLGIKFNSSHDYESRGQPSSFGGELEQRKNDKSVTDERFQPYKQLVPTSQFSNMRLPMEEALERQASIPPGDTASRHEAPCPISSLRTGEMKVSQGTSKICSGKSPIIIDVEDCVPEVAFSTEREKDMHENSPVSSEDLAACVVEDSEDEFGTESIRKGWRPPPS